MTARPPFAARRARARQRGIALLEALIAIVILGIGLLGTVGMQARSVSALVDAGQRAEATIAAEKLLGIMNNDLPNLNAYAVAEGSTPSTTLRPWADETRERIPGAILGVTLAPMAAGTSTVQITIRWTRKAGGAQNSHVVTSYISAASPPPA